MLWKNVGSKSCHSISTLSFSYWHNNVCRIKRFQKSREILVQLDVPIWDTNIMADQDQSSELSKNTLISSTYSSVIPHHIHRLTQTDAAFKCCRKYHNSVKTFMKKGGERTHDSCLKKRPQSDALFDVRIKTNNKKRSVSTQKHLHCFYFWLEAEPLKAALKQSHHPNTLTHWTCCCHIWLLMTQTSFFIF